MVATAVLAVCLLLPAGLLHDPTLAGLQDDPQFHSAVEVYDAGEKDLALAKFQAAIQERPEDGMLCLRIAGFLCSQRQDYARGQEFARKASELLPDLPESSLPLFACLIFFGHNEEYETRCREAVRRFPEHAATAYNLSLACQISRKRMEGLKYVEKAIELAPDQPLYRLAAGEVCLKIRRYQDAEAHFRECLRLKPDDAGGLTRLAEVLGYQNRDTEAEELYRRGLRRKIPDAIFSFAVFLFQRERIQEALPLFRQFTEFRPQERMAWSYLARCYQAKGRAKPARKALERFRALQLEADSEEDERLRQIMRLRAAEQEQRKKDGASDDQ